MDFKAEQKGVFIRMALAMIVTLSVIGYGYYANPFGYEANLDFSQQVHAISPFLICLVIPLMVSIGRQAGQRFFSPSDIDSQNHSSASERSKNLQCMLQNTLEQTVLAILIYWLWMATMPANYLSCLAIASLLFLLGRILFITGFMSGAVSRAFGFAITFYPSIALFLMILIYGV